MNKLKELWVKKRIKIFIFNKISWKNIEKIIIMVKLIKIRINNKQKININKNKQMKCKENIIL